MVPALTDASGDVFPHTRAVKKLKRRRSSLAIRFWRRRRAEDGPGDTGFSESRRLWLFGLKFVPMALTQTPFGAAVNAARRHTWPSTPCYSPNGSIPTLLKPPAIGKKFPVVNML